MKDEIESVLIQFGREKGISRDDLLEAIREALMAAARKAVGPARGLRLEIDEKTWEIRAFAKLIVVDRVKSKHDHISLFDARKEKPDVKIGDEIEVEVTPKDLGRIAAGNARQYLLQYFRRIEKQKIFQTFRDRVGGIVAGTVRRFDRSDVIVEVEPEKYEALLPSSERVPTEEYQVGERIRCYVKAVENTPQGPEIILSRADPQFVIKLFELEVTEIKDGTIEIKGIAREAGYRTKLAVWTKDPKVDPVGACVGLRGQRVKNIVRELNNEKVDIIRWAPDLETYVANALNPAKIKAFELDQDRKVVRILVEPDQLSLAIGRRGQNARLTSKLTGWHVDIKAEQETKPGFEEKRNEAIEALASVPGISQEQARLLVQHGWTGLDQLVQAEQSDIEEIEPLADQAAAILEAARAEAKRRTHHLGPTSSVA